MKTLKHLFIATLCFSFLTSCFDDMDDNLSSSLDIKDFVWQGMNAVYLYKSEKPDLANNRFTSDQEYRDYLESFGGPEELFENLIYERQAIDRFSWITDDYIALEQQFNGTTTSNGMEFSLYYAPNSTNDIIGVVRLVLPNSEASNAGLKRGDIFYAVNETSLTENNYLSLLQNQSYNLSLAIYNDNGTPEDDTDDSIEPTDESVSISKVPYTENPVYLTEVFEVNGENVGYIMYNGFTSDFNSQLNNAFGELQSASVQHLVLDLRYNPGGSVNSATLLGSMVTGGLNGEIFAKQEYNEDIMSQISNPENLLYRFTSSFNGNSINSLNLDQLYVITTDRTASASEMIINSLKAYIDVVQVGVNTVGKSQASITIYDSPDFTREGVNPTHTYAMQPLVAITKNVNDQVVPHDGLVPDINIVEDYKNLGVLGNQNEPMLALALANIAGTGRFSPHQNLKRLKPVADSNDFIKFEEDMQIDKALPSFIFNNTLEE